MQIHLVFQVFYLYLPVYTGSFEIGKTGVVITAPVGVSTGLLSHAATTVTIATAAMGRLLFDISFSY